MKKITTKILSVLLTVLFALSGVIVPTATEVEEIDDIGDLGGNFYFQVESDKDMFSYMPGNSVIFTVKLFSKNKQIAVPYLLYTIERDDGTKNSGKVDVDSDGNYIIVDYTMDVPGYVRLLIDFPDQNGNKNRAALKEHQRSAFEGGILVDVEHITTVHERPEDFEEFWDDSLALLDDYSPDPLELKLVEDTSSFSVYEVYINCYGDKNDLKSGDTFAAGYLNVPKNKKAGTVPIKMTFQGYGVTGASISTSSTYIVLNMCAHSFKLGLDKYDSDLLNLPLDSLGYYGWSPSENENPENVYFRNMVLRNVQAARFLMKYFGDQSGVSETIIDDVDVSAWKGLWNGIDFEAMGGSQGGFQSISLGALCPQVSRIKANIPAYGNLAAGGYNNPTGGVLGSLSIRTKYVDGLDYCDTTFFASLLNCDIDITGGMGDMTCSPTSLMAMYNNAKQNKNINVSISLQQGETHMFKPDPNMVRSSLAVYKSEITDWSIKDGVLNISANGILSPDMSEVVEWNKRMADIREINVYGNVTDIEDGVFSIKNKTNVYLKTSNSVKISQNSFDGSKDVILYLNTITQLDGFAEPEGIDIHSMGTLDQQGAFSYTLNGETLRIYSQDMTLPLATTSGDTALVNFAKNNAEKVKSIEIIGEFSSIGNMQPVFSKLTSVIDVKIDDRITALSDEKNFMGLSSLVSLGHYDFFEDETVIYTTGKIDLTGFELYVDNGGSKGIPSHIFSGCRSLKTVIMPDTLMCGEENVAGIIGEKAFADCSSLETVEFPANATLTSLAFGVFSKCTSLQKVIVKGEVSKNFSCVLNISKLQSFAQVPETAIFEVGSDEFADIINAKLSEGELSIKAVSNGTYSPSNNNSESKSKDMSVIVITAAVAALVIAVAVLIIVFSKKKNKK